MLSRGVLKQEQVYQIRGRLRRLLVEEDIQVVELRLQLPNHLILGLSFVQIITLAKYQKIFDYAFENFILTNLMKFKCNIKFNFKFEFFIIQIHSYGLQ
ncbi:hypothetical protein BpHYR1_033298 [Brachionus plicatilis]|uniref:Uncharacterized protein n=1 Tax=Brachionus plicatilis TaxID=10195 RepID=A0A3M7S725_BRAPC|nr:hypothetical protein BpHYR1_033298 [Brachionus plicatilis]